jgi:hypothetical protein
VGWGGSALARDVHCTNLRLRTYTDRSGLIFDRVRYGDRSAPMSEATSTTDRTSSKTVQSKFKTGGSKKRLRTAAVLRRYGTLMPQYTENHVICVESHRM